MAFPILNFPSEQSPTDTYSVLGSVTASEEYRTAPIFSGFCSATYTDTTESYIEAFGTLDPAKRYALYILEDSDGRQTLHCTGQASWGFTLRFSDPTKPWATTTGQLPEHVYNYNYMENFSGSYTTNIPIFADSTAASNYYSAATDTQALYYLQEALNYSDEAPDGEDWEMLCQWAVGEWTSFSSPNPTTINTLGYRGRIISGAPSITPIPGISDIPGGKALIYSVDLRGCTFYTFESTNDGTTWVSADPNEVTFFYRKRKNEIGTFAYALTYIDTGTDGNPDDDPDTDPPGDPDDGEDWGEVYTHSYFQQQYFLSGTALAEISDKLYDVSPGGIWEDIKKGIEMYGANPMDSVVNLTFYPFDLTTVFTHVNADTNVWFGGYQCALTNTVYKVLAKDGFFKCGGITFRKYFKDKEWNWMNYHNVRCFVDLPYCGRYEISLEKYWDKFINIFYFIDLTTGACEACLCYDTPTTGLGGKILDAFHGQIGTQVPITLTDFSSYANSQIQTLLGGGGQSVTQAGSSINQATSAAAAGSMASAAAGVAGAGIAGGIIGAKTVYGLQMNNINKFNETRGGSTGMLNQYLNQTPRFIFYYSKPDIPSDFYQKNGYPSNASGPVSMFSGYLEVDTVKISVPGATDSEKDKIRQLLLGGVYL